MLRAMGSENVSNRPIERITAAINTRDFMNFTENFLERLRTLGTTPTMPPMKVQTRVGIDDGAADA